MLYQLPNGKVVHLSLEDYLNLTEKDIQYLLSINAGDYIASPWAESAIGRNRRDPEEDEEEEDEDDGTEYYEFDEDFFPPEFDNIFSAIENNLEP
jgi:hypothetical protein